MSRPAGASAFSFQLRGEPARTRSGSRPPRSRSPRGSTSGSVRWGWAWGRRCGRARSGERRRGVVPFAPYGRCGRQANVIRPAAPGHRRVLPRSTRNGVDEPAPRLPYLFDQTGELGHGTDRRTCGVTMPRRPDWRAGPLHREGAKLSRRARKETSVSSTCVQVRLLGNAGRTDVCNIESRSSRPLRTLTVFAVNKTAHLRIPTTFCRAASAYSATVKGAETRCDSGSRCRSRPPP
jgi:hypothetical protein